MWLNWNLESLCENRNWNIKMGLHDGKRPTTKELYREENCFQFKVFNRTWRLMELLLVGSLWEAHSRLIYGNSVTFKQETLKMLSKKLDFCQKVKLFSKNLIKFVKKVWFFEKTLNFPLLFQKLKHLLPKFPLNFLNSFKNSQTFAFQKLHKSTTWTSPNKKSLAAATKKVTSKHLLQHLLPCKSQHSKFARKH